MSLTKKNFKDYDFEPYENFENCFIVKRTVNVPKAYYAMFMAQGAKIKPLFCHMFRNNEERDKYIEKQVKLVDLKVEEDKKRKAEKKKQLDDLNIEVGTILNSNWGYGQTNVEFYQVVGFKGRTVKLREIAKKYDDSKSGHCDMSGYFLPVKDKFINDEILTRRVGYNMYSKNIKVKINDVVEAWLWGGESEYISWYN